jgi:hypothetical protein
VANRGTLALPPSELDDGVVSEFRVLGDESERVGAGIDLNNNKTRLVVGSDGHWNVTLPPRWLTAHRHCRLRNRTLHVAQLEMAAETTFIFGELDVVPSPTGVGTTRLRRHERQIRRSVGGDDDLDPTLRVAETSWNRFVGIELAGEGVSNR